MVKVAILAGGFGTRLAEETEVQPKPMTRIGEYPIIWHIMRIFDHFGLRDFYVATGYKGEILKEYFVHYSTFRGSIAVDLASGHVTNYGVPPLRWTVHLIDTGTGTQTGGRIRRMRDWLAGPEPFIVTYGDGVADVDIDALLRFHRSHGKLATMTVVRPPARFGAVNCDGDRIASFSEKPQSGEGWINGGFMVFESGIFDYLRRDQDSLEYVGLEPLAKAGELMAYHHTGFWQCMDTLRDKHHLESLWKSEKPPWKMWND